MRRLHLLQGKLWPAFYWDSEGVLVIDFLIEQRTINAAYYSKLLKDLVKSPFVQNDELDQSKASVASTTTSVTTGTLEEMRWEVLPHPASSLTWSQAIFTRSVHRQALGRKIFRTDDEVKLSMKRWPDEPQQTLSERA
jgi:hypothetical protein